MEPDFPSLADEIAEARPDMNIKVAAFTVSEKSSNTCMFRVFRKKTWFFYFRFITITSVQVEDLTSAANDET